MATIKFTVCVIDDDQRHRHVIAKFSEPADSHPSARRWADLLISEHVASRVLADHGHDSARTELIASQGRMCLESTRFDRVNEYGRQDVVTLAAWSDAHDGMRDNWTAAAERMYQDRWISESTLQRVRLRWWFGRLIGNSGMHFGNPAFFLDDSLPLTLAPSYDMLPMRYRHAASGAMLQQILEPPVPLPDDRTAWQAAANLAQTY